MDKLVGAKLIGIVSMIRGAVLRLYAFPKVGAPGPFVDRANAIAPIITVGKTSAREPYYRSLDLAHVIDQLFTNSIDLRDRRVLANPNAIIDYAAEIFGEVPVDIGRNHS